MGRGPVSRLGAALGRLLRLPREGGRAGIFRRGLGGVLAVALLAGCGAPAAQPAASPVASPNAVVQAYLTDIFRTPFHFHRAYELLTSADRKVVSPQAPWAGQAAGAVRTAHGPCAVALTHVDTVLFQHLWAALAGHARWRLAPAQVLGAQATVQVSLGLPSTKQLSGNGAANPLAQAFGAPQSGRTARAYQQELKRELSTPAAQAALNRMHQVCNGHSSSSGSQVGAEFALVFLPAMTMALNSGKLPLTYKSVVLHLRRSASGAWRISLPSGTKSLYGALPGTSPTGTPQGG